MRVLATVAVIVACISASVSLAICRAGRDSREALERSDEARSAREGRIAQLLSDLDSRLTEETAYRAELLRQLSGLDARIFILEASNAETLKNEPARQADVDPMPLGIVDYESLTVHDLANVGRSIDPKRSVLYRSESGLVVAHCNIELNEEARKLASELLACDADARLLQMSYARELIEAGQSQVFEDMLSAKAHADKTFGDRSPSAFFLPLARDVIHVMDMTPVLADLEVLNRDSRALRRKLRNEHGVSMPGTAWPLKFGLEGME